MAGTRKETISGGERFRAALAKIAQDVDKETRLKVGFLEGANYPSVHPVRGTKQAPHPVAQVAFWNEYGTVRAPPRPFMRTTVAKESNRWGALIAAVLPTVDYDGARALSQAGEAMRDDLRVSIQQWSAPPNAESTVQKKGFQKPLIDSGIMRDGLDFEVTK